MEENYYNIMINGECSVNLISLVRSRTNNRSERKMKVAEN